MSSPDLTLCRLYGNDLILQQKLAGGRSLAGRLAMGLVAGAMGEHSHQQAEDQREQAQIVNEAFREYMLEQMGPAIQGAKHTRVPLLIPAGSDVPAGYDEGMVRMASVIGADLAQMEKSAIGVVPPTGAGGGVGGAVAGIGNALKGMFQKAPFKAGKMPGVPGAGAAQNYRTPAPQVSPRASSIPPSAPSTTPAPAAGAAPAAAAAAPAAAGAAGASTATSSPGTSTSGGQPPGWWDKFKQHSGITAQNWKTKAMIGAAGAAGIYGLYRAGKGALNWMGKEQGPQSYNQGGPQLAYGVNEYGTPQLGTPFQA